MWPNLKLLKATLTGALGGLLFGFDTVVIAGIIDSIVRAYQLSDYQKGLTVAVAPIGTVIGCFVAGTIGQRMGSRTALRYAATVYLLSAACSALAVGWPILLLTRVIGGVGIGAASVLGPVYITELSPARWRGRLVGTFQFNVVLGILVGYTSNYLVRLAHLGRYEWRVMVGVATVPAAIFLTALFHIPRSPRWSASRNQIDEAIAVLTEVGSPNPWEELANIQAAINSEHASAHEPVLQWKYRYPLFLAISNRRF